ncbi:membrane protein [Clostridium acetobutylicum]|nr:membrane protein [Clostridium acetobutylicum]
MKRFFSYICILLSVFTTIGCTKNEKLTNINEFKMNKAIATVNKYMTAYTNNDFSKMQQLYGKSLKKEASGSQQSALKITSYKIMDTTEMGTTANIRVNVIRSDQNSPYTSIDTDIFKIKKSKGKYLIEKISSTNDKEVFQYKRNLMVKIKDEAKSNILINLVGVPEYYFSKGDPLKIDKIKVSKDGFSFLSASNDGNMAIISTAGANPLIGVCEIQDLEQQGGGNGGNGQNASQSQSDQSLSDESQPFQVAAKSIKVIDVYKNAQVKDIAYSNDDGIIAVQCLENNSMRIKMYEAQSGDLVSKQVDKKFPADKFDLTLVKFDEKYLIFDSKPRNANEPKSKDKAGQWRVNLKTYKVSKAKGKS